MTKWDSCWSYGESKVIESDNCWSYGGNVCYGELAVAKNASSSNIAALKLLMDM